MNNQNVNSARAAVAPILKKFYYYDIKDMAGLADFDMEILNGLGFDAWKQENTSIDQLVSEIGSYFLRFDDEKNIVF